MKKIISIILCLSLITGMFALPAINDTQKVEAASEVKGLWVAYCDFKALGLYNKSESTFRKNTKKLLDKAKYYGTNTIYFHVRAFDDASWKSSTFKPSDYLTSSSKFSFDPLQIFIEESHAKGMELHAWMNPYRITHNTYLNPGKSSSTKRINKAIDELLEYDIQGIHFDDYFYTAKKNYKDISTGKTTTSKPSKAQRRANCNAMIKSAYQNTHKKQGVVFGISPAGNVENCMNMGADIKTWMKESGYVDYIAPQIYWTDNWGSKGKVKMYSDRLAQWTSLNKNNTTMYIGLALYRTGQKSSDDKGWAKRDTNLRTQVKKLRAKGAEGYILFTAPDLFDKHAKKELYKLKGLVKPIKAKSIKFTKKSRTVYLKTKPKYAVKFTPSDTNPKSVKYTSSNKKIATVNSKGKITPKKKGTVTITAKTPNGKVAKMKVKVKKFRPFKTKTTKKTTVKKTASTSSKKVKTLKKGKKLTIKKLSKNGVWGMYKKGHWVKLCSTNK